VVPANRATFSDAEAALATVGSAQGFSIRVDREIRRVVRSDIQHVGARLEQQGDTVTLER
jgi:hypothetical protein